MAPTALLPPRRMQAGNVSDSSTAVTVTLDQTKPTIEIKRPETFYTNVNPTPIKLTFSEPLMGFEESDITVEGGTITAGSYQVVSGGDVDVTFTITPSGDGLFQVIQLSIAKDVATDVAGNGNESVRSNFVYDGTFATPDAPVITQPTTPTNANPITISGSAEADATITLTQNDNALTTTVDSSGTWSIEVTLSANNNGVNTFTATATDVTGNVSA